MLCSIIINNYNYADYLGQAIDSALNQTYDSVEVVVVDDGSSDKSVDLIRSYGDRVVAVIKENGGQGSAMNVGFAASHGELIFFLDADDWLEPNAVERVIEAYEPGVAHFYFQMTQRGEGGKSLGIFELQFKQWDEGASVYRTLLDRGAANFPPTSANAFSRKCLNAILPMPDGEFRIRADVYLLYRAAFQGEVRAVREALSNYRIHGSNNWFVENSGGTKRPIWKRSLRKDRKVFQRGMLRAKQKLDLLETERSALSEKWGVPALRRLYALRWRQLISFKALGDMHPFTEDTLDQLISDIFEVSRELGTGSSGLKLRIALIRLLPASALKFILFKES